MAQWAHFGRVRTPFHLYVPAAAVEIARRLCTENRVGVSEIWSYHSIGDQTRFTLVQRVNSVPMEHGRVADQPDQARQDDVDGPDPVCPETNHEDDAQQHESGRRDCSQCEEEPQTYLPHQAHDPPSGSALNLSRKSKMS